MAVRLMNAPGLSQPPGYSHLAIGSGRTLIATAGQVPLDEQGHLVGEGDHQSQTEQVLRNLLVVLQTAGAKLGDVVKTTVYVVGNSHEAQNLVWSVFRQSQVARAPSTLIGVERLGYRGQLVEIEALAIVGG